MIDRADIADLVARVKRGETVRLPRLERASVHNRDAWLVIERWEDGHTVKHGPVVGNEKLADLFLIVDALDEAGYYDLIMPPAR